MKYDYEYFQKMSKPAMKNEDWLKWEQKIIKEARRKNRKVYGRLDDAEMLALVRYTQGDYEALNWTLRNGTPGQKNEWEGYKKTLNSALSKLPTYQGIVCRGAKGLGSYDSAYQVGKVVSDNAFVSTCAGSDPPSKFRGQYEFLIKPKTGRYIENLSVFGYKNKDIEQPETDKLNQDREAEVLFATDTKFLVTGRENTTMWVPYTTDFRRPAGSTEDGEYVPKTIIYMVEI